MCLYPLAGPQLKEKKLNTDWGTERKLSPLTYNCTVYTDGVLWKVLLGVDKETKIKQGHLMSWLIKLKPGPSKRKAISFLLYSPCGQLPFSVISFHPTERDNDSAEVKLFLLSCLKHLNCYFNIWVWQRFLDAWSPDSLEGALGSTSMVHIHFQWYFHISFSFFLLPTARGTWESLS